MADLFRDPAWQFVGAALSLIAIAVTIWIASRQRTKRRLVYRYKFESRLVSVDEAFTGRVQILFDDLPVHDARLFVLRLRNAGNTPISSTSYERPVTLAFFGEGRLLSATVTEEYPARLGALVTFDEQQVTLTPLLMNPGDFLTIKMLVDGAARAPIPDGRIEGVKRIAAEEDPVDWKLMALAPVGLLVSLGGLAGFLPGMARLSPPLRLQYNILLFGYTLGCLACTLLMLRAAVRRLKSDDT
jgi:hypothetical protein